MNIPASLRIIALGLALTSVAFAQTSPPTPPTPPADAPQSLPVAPAATSQVPIVTQSSRVRAFNPGPGGEVRSLYLQNGSVVDVTPALGGQLGAAVRKGEKITVTGTQSEINGQSLLEAASIRLNDQTFSANMPPGIPSGPGALAESAVPLRLAHRKHLRLHPHHGAKTRPLHPLRAAFLMTHLRSLLTLVALLPRLQTEWDHHRRRPIVWDHRRLLLTGWLRRHLKTEEPLRCVCK